MTQGQGPRRNRLVFGRPRKSTLVLIGLFLGFLALYVMVRPVSTSTTNTGNVQQGNPAPTHTTPSYTQAPRHDTQSPTPSHSPTPRASQTPSHTPTPAPATSTGTGTGTPIPATT